MLQSFFWNQLIKRCCEIYMIYTVKCLIIMNFKWYPCLSEAHLYRIQPHPTTKAFYKQLEFHWILLIRTYFLASGI